MEKKGCSRKGFFGETIHYDADGNKVGESRKNFSGGYDHFDSNGNTCRFYALYFGIGFALG